MTDSIASGVDIKIDGLSAIARINPANGIHHIWVMTSAHEHKLPLSSIKPTISTPSLKEHSVPASIQSMLHSFETKCTPMLMLIPPSNPGRLQVKRIHRIPDSFCDALTNCKIRSIPL
jgi:hypothetical protein